MNDMQVKPVPKIAMLAITLHGIELLKTLASQYPQADIYLSGKFMQQAVDFPEINQPKLITGPIKTMMGELFEHYDLLLLVFSIGAAVRLMAPWLKSKREDPGVVVIDDNAQFVVPILSGHIGGANAFATELSERINATPVFTTASEARQTLAVDILGRELGWFVEASHTTQVKVAADVVNERPIAFIQEAGSKDWWPSNKKLPENIHLFSDFEEVNISNFASILWVTHREISAAIKDSLEERLIVYRPPLQRIVLGMGCDRNTPLESIETAVSQTLEKARLSFDNVIRLASIDKKSDETGLLDFAKKYHRDMDFFCAEQLSQVSVPNPSEVVRKYVGTPAVAEAAALLSANTEKHDLIIEKHKFRGADNRNVTVSIARYRSENFQ